MDRRRFLSAVGVAVVGLGGHTNPLTAALAQLGERLGSLPGEVPDVHIGRSEVAGIASIADTIERRAHIVGGGAAENRDTAADEFESAMLTVRMVQTALAADRSAALDRDLYTAAGWLFRAVGFMAFDTGRITVAHDLLWTAQECAMHAGNGSLEARVLGTRARQDAWSGEPATAAQLLVRALNLPRLSYTEQAMLYALQARALGRFGMAPQTLRAVAESDEAMQRALDGNEAEGLRAERPWVGFFDLGHQQGDTGRALLDLAFAMGANVPQAIIDDGLARNRRTLDAIDLGQHSRSATFTAFNLSAVQLLAGAPDEALMTGHEGIRLAAGIKSRRVDEHMRMLRDVCDDRCRGVRDASELSEAIGLALVAS